MINIRNQKFDRKISYLKWNLEPRRKKWMQSLQFLISHKFLIFLHEKMRIQINGKAIFSFQKTFPSFDYFLDILFLPKSTSNKTPKIQATKNNQSARTKNQTENQQKMKKWSTGKPELAQITVKRMRQPRFSRLDHHFCG